MIFGKFRKKIIGTTKCNGVEVLGTLSRRRVIEATRYGTKIEALSAISNYCHSWKFQKMVVEKYNFKFDIIHPSINDKHWYISVDEKV